MVFLAGAIVAAVIGIGRQMTVTPRYEAAARLYEDGPGGPRLFALAASADDPRRAAAEANARAAEYVRGAVERRVADVDGRLGQLGAELVQVQATVTGLEHRLAARRKDAAQGRQAARRLPGLVASVGHARERRVMLGTFVGHIDIKAATTAVLHSPTAHALAVNVLDLERDRAALSNRYGERHPAVERFDRLLQGAREESDRANDLVVQTLVNEYELIAHQERALVDELAAATTDVRTGERAVLDATALGRRLDAEREVLRTLLAYERELREQRHAVGAPIRIVDPAAPPRRPVTPNPAPYARTVIVLTLIGLVTGFRRPKQTPHPYTYSHHTGHITERRAPCRRGVPHAHRAA
jgi:hypothetical protein